MIQYKEELIQDTIDFLRLSLADVQKKFLLTPIEVCMYSQEAIDIDTLCNAIYYFERMLEEELKIAFKQP